MTHPFFQPPKPVVSPQHYEILNKQFVNEVKAFMQWFEDLNKKFKALCNDLDFEYRYHNISTSSSYVGLASFRPHNTILFPSAFFKSPHPGIKIPRLSKPKNMSKSEFQDCTELWNSIVSQHFSQKDFTHTYYNGFVQAYPDLYFNPQNLYFEGKKLIAYAYPSDMAKLTKHNIAFQPHTPVNH